MTIKNAVYRELRALRILLGANLICQENSGAIGAYTSEIIFKYLSVCPFLVPLSVYTKLYTVCVSLTFVSSTQL